MTFEDAEASCIAKGGYLASLRDQAEIELLLSGNLPTFTPPETIGEMYVHNIFILILRL